MSIRTALGCDGNPGIVRISPQIGYTKPAPTEALTSRTGSFQPVGAPFSFGSDEIDSAVLARRTPRGRVLSAPVARIGCAAQRAVGVFYHILRGQEPAGHDRKRTGVHLERADWGDDPRRVWR